MDFPSPLLVLQIVSLFHVFCALRINLRRVTRAASDEEFEIAIPLSSYENVYYGDVTVGTAREGEKEQVFSVLFDTGSTHLWIANKGCETTQKLTTFDPASSTTFLDLIKTFYVSYADGTSVKGKWVQDTIKIQINKEKITAENQMFGLVDHIKNKDLLERLGGVFGLGIYQTDTYDTAFMSLTKQSGIQPIFGFYFDRKADGKNDGELVFGGLDEHLVEGAFTYHDVLKEADGQYRRWIINIDKITVKKGDMILREIRLKNIVAHIDSGTNHISGPPSILASINEVLFDHRHWTIYRKEKYFFSCGENWSVLPDVFITMDGHDYLLTPEDYVWGKKYDSEKYCRSAFDPGEDDDNFTIGQPFLKRYYTQYDIGKKRIGFAKAKASASKDEPTSP